MEASQAYHMPIAARLVGELDRRALDRIVLCYEALRTTFGFVDGEPVQQVAQAGNGFCLTEQDLDCQTDALSAVDAFAAEEASAPFDLRFDPLIRGRLVELNAGDRDIRDISTTCLKQWSSMMLD